MVGVSQPTVSDWFNNKKDPSGKRLEKLSEVLQVSRAVILGLDEAPDITETKKEPAEAGEQKNRVADLCVALGVTHDELQKILAYAEGLKAARKQ